MLADGWKRHSNSQETNSSSRRSNQQPLQREDEIGVHAYVHYGAWAMALLRPAWLRHGWRVVDEWDDEVAGVPVVRHRATRMVPLDDDGMTGHEFNPVVFHEAEDVVFAYDPERDVVREWYDLWDGKPCSRYTFVSLTFRDTAGIGDSYLIGNV